MEKLESLLGFFLVTLFFIIYIILPLVMILAIVRCRPCVRVGVFLIAIVVTNIQSFSAGRRIGETDKYKEILRKTSSPYDKLFKHLEDLVNKGEYCALSNDLVRLRKEGFVIFTPVFPVQKTFEETVDEILCRDIIPISSSNACNRVE